MLPDLSRDHTVIAWDAPGFGQSSDIDDSWRARQFAEALAELIAALGVERPHVVGHSFGSMLALAFFEHHRSTPASLVLLGDYAGWLGSLPAGEVSSRLRAFLDVSFERVIVSHGEPVHDRAAFERALELPPYSDPE